VNHGAPRRTSCPSQGEKKAPADTGAEVCVDGREKGTIPRRAIIVARRCGHLAPSDGLQLSPKPRMLIDAASLLGVVDEKAPGNPPSGGEVCVVDGVGKGEPPAAR
jgi:hypothetical protein